MTAPVTRFSWRMPVVDVTIIKRETILTASEMPRTIPIIIFLFPHPLHHIIFPKYLASLVLFFYIVFLLVYKKTDLLLHLFLFQIVLFVFSFVSVSFYSY